MNEKGVSPLMATIVLIVISVGLGSFVMSVSEFPENGCSIEYNINTVEQTGEILFVSVTGDAEGFLFKMFSRDYGQSKVFEELNGNEYNIPVNFEVFELELIPIQDGETCFFNQQNKILQ